MPIAEQNKITRLFYDIYIADEQEAFQQGFRFGFCLSDELRQAEEAKREKPAWTFPCPGINKEVLEKIVLPTVVEE